MFREWSNNYFFLNLVQLSIGFFFFFFFPLSSSSHLPARRLAIERKKLMKIFRLNMWNKEKKNLYTIYATHCSLSIPYVQIVYVPCTRERGILIERFPGRCSWGQTVNNDTRAQSLRNVPVLPRTVDSCLIIVRKITKVLRHFERKRTRIHLRTVHRNRSCSVAITNSLPRGIRVLSLPIYLVFKADMSEMSRYDVPSTRNSSIIDPNVQEALEFDSL